MDFTSTVEKFFPGSIDEARFIERTREVLDPLGFTPENTFALVGGCRDELCRPLHLGIQRTWGEAFEISSLAGMVNCGRTGLQAAHGHAPIEGGRARYIYVVMPHIGIGEGGELGLSRRLGREGISHACGALAGIHAELARGEVDIELHWDDVEQSLLRQRLLAHLSWGSKPNLAELTHLTEQIARDDLEALIAQDVDPKEADYAVFTGIQIHAMDGADLSWIDRAYAVVGGERHTLSV
ncbi:MAG: hypothetical protein KAI47_14175 [Deltaproteobacteria bacterium]|nr:hypothetical protein [Deltaproteobacteria bacterium]